MTKGIKRLELYISNIVNVKRKIYFVKNAFRKFSQCYSIVGRNFVGKK